MDIRMTMRGEFDAKHRIPGDQWCGRGDGHTWRVEVSVPAHHDPATGSLHARDELLGAVWGFCSELNHGDVNEMLPGSPPTADGVALALRERLLMDFPEVRVTVWMADNFGVTVE